MASKLKKKKARVFIMGISGFLGMQMAYALRDEFSVVGAYFTHPVYIPEVHMYPVDLKSYSDVLEHLLLTTNPDICIAATGMNNSKQCEDNPQHADSINSLMPLSLAQSSQKARSKFILLSCSQVFDGSKGDAKEDEKHFATNMLGKSKSTGELYIRAQTQASTILRFGKVLGAGPRHRVTTIDKIRQAITKKEKYLLEDEDRIFNFLSVPYFTNSLKKILESELPTDSHQYIHLGGAKYDELGIYRKIAEKFGGDPSLIQVKKRKQAKEEEHEKKDISEIEDLDHANLKDFSIDASNFENKFNIASENLDELIENINTHFKPAFTHPFFEA